jgi:hypothetical protein
MALLIATAASPGLLAAAWGVHTIHARITAEQGASRVRPLV